MLNGGPRLKIRLAGVLLASVALFACGGDDGGNSGSSGGPVAGAPTPSPSPTPTPTVSYDPAFDVNQSAEYELIGALLTREMIEGMPSSLTVATQLFTPETPRIARYFAAERQVDVTIGTGGFHTFAADDAREISAGRLSFAQFASESSRNFALFLIGGAAGAGSYSSSSTYSLGVNIHETNALYGDRRRWTTGYYVTGVRTVNGTVNTTGSTDYLSRPRVAIYENGEEYLYVHKTADNDVDDSTYSLLRADWATGKISGTLTLRDVNLNASGEFELEVTAELRGGTATPKGPLISGSVRTNDGRTGQLSGSLYGPRGREIGMAFVLEGNGSHGAGVIYARPNRSPP